MAHDVEGGSSIRGQRKKGSETLAPKQLSKSELIEKVNCNDNKNSNPIKNFFFCVEFHS